MTIPAEYNVALKYLEDNKTALPGLNGADQDRVVIEIKDIVSRLYDRKPEDLRAAVVMAIDAAKTLTTIGIAFFVALGGFAVQYVSNHNSVISWWSLLITVSAVLTVISIINGFRATGVAFKNAQGISNAGTPAQMWSTEPLKGYLDRQSWIGLLALICFGISLFFWSTPPTGGLTATQVTVSSPPPNAGSRLRIEGNWTNLTIRRGGLSFSPTASPPGQVSAVDVELR